MAEVFVSGGTGYLGVPLIEALVRAGWDVHALCRPQSIRKVPTGVTVIPGNALDVSSFSECVPRAAVYVHLTGVARPSPAKVAEFLSIDRTAFLASLAAARAAGVCRFVYVSVAHPAPVMREYIAVRRECEQALLESGLVGTILRPWYVLGPGHWWPYALLPVYKVAEAIPPWRAVAQRLGLLHRREMVSALVHAVQSRKAGVEILDVPKIRAISCGEAWASPQVPSSPHRPSGLSA